MMQHPSPIDPEAMAAVDALATQIQGSIDYKAEALDSAQAPAASLSASPTVEPALLDLPVLPQVNPSD